jgi:hypothetical protein
MMVEIEDAVLAGIVVDGIEVLVSGDVEVSRSS